MTAGRIECTAAAAMLPGVLPVVFQRPSIATPLIWLPPPPQWRVPHAQAPAEAAAAYEARLAERAAAAAAAARDSEAGAGAGAGASIPGLPPGVSVADAAELAAPGSRDGETKLVREADGGVNVYSWAAARSTWELLGAVVEPPSAPGTPGCAALCCC